MFNIINIYINNLIIIFEKSACIDYWYLKKNKLLNIMNVIDKLLDNNEIKINKKSNILLLKQSNNDIKWNWIRLWPYNLHKYI